MLVVNKMISELTLDVRIVVVMQVYGYESALALFNILNGTF
jgi:hypothetical protein